MLDEVEGTRFVECREVVLDDGNYCATKVAQKLWADTSRG